MDSALETSLLVVVGGIIGVLVGGWMDRRRERWRWRLESRRSAYSTLLERMERFQRACDQYWDKLRAGGKWQEIEPMFEPAEQRGAQLREAINDIRILGSPDMQHLVEFIDEDVWDVMTSIRQPPEFESLWDRREPQTGDSVGLVWSFLEDIDAVLALAQRELRVQSLAERWATWRARWRAKRMARRARRQSGRSRREGTRREG